MDRYRILAINPGSTTTKLALFENTNQVMEQNVVHDWQALKELDIIDQLPLRMETINAFLDQLGLDNVDAVVGRGGQMKPLRCGVYLCCQAMENDLRATTRKHASTLGVLLARKFAAKFGCEAYTVNPISVSEAAPIAKICGLKEFVRDNNFAPLNQKEVGRRLALKLGKPYEECNLLIAQMGGGIAVGAHQRGLCIDSAGAVRGEGPFSGRRAGGIPPGQLVDLCFSEGMTKQAVDDKLMKTGGLVSHLGTDDGIEIERRIGEGDEYAALVYKALAYRVAKEIGAYATVLMGEVDAIALTGGMANSKMLCRWIEERVGFIAPVHIFPGTVELDAMAQGVYDVLSGARQASRY